MNRSTGYAAEGTPPEVRVRRLPPESVLRLLSPAMQVVLRSPLHRAASDYVLLIRSVDPDTGERYTVPAVYEQLEDAVIVPTHATDWWQHLRDSGQVTVWLHGERRDAIAEATDDPGAVADYLREYFERNGPEAARLLGLRIDSDGLPSNPALERVARRGLATVRVECVDGRLPKSRPLAVGLAN